MWQQLWLDVDLAGAFGLPGADADGRLADAALAVDDGRVAWLGRRGDLPDSPAALARELRPAGRRLLTPALIDCHTHLIFGGDRSGDFALRTAGKSYAAIAAAGGGIRSTVAATHALDVESLAQAALPRARALAAEGVLTVEVKSGYGLDAETEIRMLRAAQRLAQLSGLEIVPTLLALHALPAEFAADRAGYVSQVADELIPEVARLGLAAAVDVFCEHIAFTRAECARVLEAARRHGLAVKVHAEQLSAAGGASLAAEYGALSADHLEYLPEADCAALAAAGTVAVLLPGAFLMTGETRRPPVSALRLAGVPLAVATDCNPGTSPCTSLTLSLTLARAQFGLTVAEALRAVTANSARALGLGGSHGELAVGRRADFCLWDFDHPRQFGYWLAPLRPRHIVRAGVDVTARFRENG